MDGWNEEFMAMTSPVERILQHAEIQPGATFWRRTRREKSVFRAMCAATTGWNVDFVCNTD
jgi:hypothetical protein